MIRSTETLEIYERARAQVTIERSDGRRQRYAAVRYKQEIDKGYGEGALVPTVARIIRRPTLGFSHLEETERPDLMLETLGARRDQALPPALYFKDNRDGAATHGDYYARHGQPG